MPTTSKRALTIERDALSGQLDAERRAGAALALERDQYMRDFRAMSDRAVELAERVTMLEAQLGATEVKLGIAAATTEQACARIEDLSERIAAIAGESFGAVPVQCAEENLSTIERGISTLRQAPTEREANGKRRRRGSRGSR